MLALRLALDAAPHLTILADATPMRGKAQQRPPKLCMLSVPLLGATEPVLWTLFGVPPLVVQALSCLQAGSSAHQ